MLRVVHASDEGGAPARSVTMQNTAAAQNATAHHHASHSGSHKKFLALSSMRAPAAVHDHDHVACYARCCFRGGRN